MRQKGTEKSVLFAREIDLILNMNKQMRGLLDENNSADEPFIDMKTFHSTLKE